MKDILLSYNESLFFICGLSFARAVFLYQNKAHQPIFCCYRQRLKIKDILSLYNQLKKLKSLLRK
ncbi:hypothetical protein SAMN05216431_10358 [Ligilactobacillus sp. WC1T17]|uniref:Uncharacterized protein n=1 Tax=Ligilactobacillus ruminis TaxID=1623 RepID=A0ABY1AA48_9LACO|nr:hypothetical protein SAMN05216431_10358 [Ligilactobacillus ruminis]